MRKRAGCTGKDTQFLLASIPRETATSVISSADDEVHGTGIGGSRWKICRYSDVSIYSKD